MSKKFQITDSDIEDMFEKNDTKVLKDDPSEDLVPAELLLDSSGTKIERPETPVIDEYHQQKKDEKVLQKQLKENKLPDGIIETSTVNILNAVARFKKEAYDKERRRELTKLAILNGGTKLNFSNRNECQHHLFLPAYILQDIVYGSCKFCSSKKTFTISEWKSYQLQNKDIL